MLIMRPKKDPDAVTIQAVLWVCVIAFGALAVIEKEPWAFWCLCVPGIVASFLYALYPRGRRIVVSEEGIESDLKFFSKTFVGNGGMRHKYIDAEYRQLSGSMDVVALACGVQAYDGIRLYF